METIELTKSNYKGYLPIDIAAFSFAVPGVWESMEVLKL